MNTVKSSQKSAARTAQNRVSHRYRAALNVCVKGTSKAEALVHRDTGLHITRISDTARVAGLPPTPEHDLVFRGGKSLPHLSYVNFYVGGSAWNSQDVMKIDKALAAAMSDPGLNNVLAQYFPGQQITSSFAKTRRLSGDAPATISRGDIDHLVQDADASGALSGFDLDSTVFNFMLPPGTVLTDDQFPSGGQPAGASENEPRSGYGDAAGARRPIVDRDEDEKASSLAGLGGYHGSVRIGQKKAYFAVGVFSQTLEDGSQNGIVAFDEPWKNVVATFYHELCEARTDPDVEDANNTGNEALVGWISAQGEEIGDFPIFEDPSLSHVFKEVFLTGNGDTVPIQLMYSNAVHGPEGPIAQPHIPALHRLGGTQLLAASGATTVQPEPWWPVTEPAKSAKRLLIELSGANEIFLVDATGNEGLVSQQKPVSEIRRDEDSSSSYAKENRTGARKAS
jgi:hypothetical protein